MIVLAGAAQAHELRPAYLDLRETAPGEFAAVWKVPAIGNRRLSLEARLPEGCEDREEPRRSFDGNAYFERRTLTCREPLAGQEVGVDGLGATYTDALLRIAFVDGTVETVRLTPDAPFARVKGVQSTVDVAAAYVLLGIEHILGGLDHLLFVLALLLLVRDWRGLVKTVTAFTLAHSITLTGVTLGWFSLPQAPVEAIVALSIAFVAREVLQSRHGGGHRSAGMPWIMAFAFGLLHGFGFAGALKEVGLPQSDIPLALLSFNLGIEAGQLAFVATVLLLAAVSEAVFRTELRRYSPVAAYAIGALAMVWFVERLANVV